MANYSPSQIRIIAEKNVVGNMTRSIKKALKMLLGRIEGKDNSREINDHPTVSLFYKKAGRKEKPAQKSVRRQA